MKRPITSALYHLRRAVSRGQDGGLSDAELLQRFAAQRDEAAFEVLVWRHGSMVLGVAQRVLHNRHDAEDVLQATFLALVRQVRSIGRGPALAAWLHKVAFRIALRARKPQRQLAGHAALEEIPAPAAPSNSDFSNAVDEELERLPRKYRTPILLSYFEGLTNREVAAQMGCPIGTVFTRLARGRELLRKRLLHRGVVVPTGLLTVGLTSGVATAALPNGLVHTLLRAALIVSTGSMPLVSAVSPRVLALVEGAAKMIWLSRLKTVVATLFIVTLASSGGLLALHSTAPEQASEGGKTDQRAGPAFKPEGQVGKPGAAADQQAPKQPRVVSVYPANGARDVDSITEIRIRFDQPMDRSSAYLTCKTDNRTGFRTKGMMRYAEARHEFILPVQLSPGCKCELTVNHESLPRRIKKQFEGFRSEKGTYAQPRRWSFETRNLPVGKGKPPRVMSMVPAPDSEVSLITPLELAFDGPMDPQWYDVSGPDSAGFQRRPELLGRPHYDPVRHRFTLLLQLPPNWNGELRLSGFRGKDGVEAEAVAVRYRTLRSIVFKTQTRRIEDAGRSAVLRKIVDHARRARRDLGSISEQVITTTTGSETQAAWYQSFKTQGARFEMSGEKFLGVIDDIMQVPFRVGSDGRTCWLRCENEQITAPAKDIQEKGLLFSDAFDAAGTASNTQVIDNLKLEYVGQSAVRGRRCYHLRSWSVTFFGPDFLSPIRDWHIDTVTLLPIRVEATGSAFHMTTDYVHSRLNQVIPDSDFKPDSSAGLRAASLEPLTNGYTSRFLNVNDGSGGRMSVRWGMKGRSGMKSSGLN